MNGLGLGFGLSLGSGLGDGDGDGLGGSLECGFEFRLGHLRAQIHNLLKKHCKILTVGHDDGMILQQHIKLLKNVKGLLSLSLSLHVVSLVVFRNANPTKTKLKLLSIFFILIAF